MRNTGLCPVLAREHRISSVVVAFPWLRLRARRLHTSVQIIAPHVHPSRYYYKLSVPDESSAGSLVYQVFQALSRNRKRRTDSREGTANQYEHRECVSRAGRSPVPHKYSLTQTGACSCGSTLESGWWHIPRTRAPLGGTSNIVTGAMRRGRRRDNPASAYLWWIHRWERAM